MNYITGIHRYTYKCGETAFVRGLSARRVRIADHWVLRTVFLTEFEDGATDWIPMESILNGTYMVTPFIPTEEDVAKFRANDRITPSQYEQYILDQR